MTIHLRNNDILLNEGEGFLVRKGIEHLTEAEEDTLIMLVEPTKIVTRGD